MFSLPCFSFFSLSPLWWRTGWEGVCWHSCTVCFALDRALARVHIPSLPSLASLTPTPPPPLLNLFNSPWLLPEPLLLPATPCSPTGPRPHSLLLLSPSFLTNASSCISHNSSPPSLPLSLLHPSSIPARGSRSSLCDTDAPSCSGRSTWERSIGVAVCCSAFRAVWCSCASTCTREGEMREVSRVCLRLTLTKKKEKKAAV